VSGEEPDVEHVSPKKWAHYIAESEQRARTIRETAQSCVVCGRSMLRWGKGRDRHFSCDVEFPYAGKRCTCPSGCSNTHWGNGPVSCDPSCELCARHRGSPLVERRKRK
jgi:hypothetical protein